VDGAGNVFITGYTPLPWGGQMPTTLKYAKDGTLLWSANAGGAGLSPGSSGEVYVTGRIEDGFGGYIAGTAKYSPSGDFLWSQIFAGANNRYALPAQIATDKHGTAFVSGQYTESDIFYNADLMTFAYSSQGEVSWTNRYYGPQNLQNEYGAALTCDPNGYAILTAQAWGNGPPPDMVLIKYASTNLNPPPVLTIERNASEIVLSWTDAAFALQSAPTITGTFTNVPGATSPFTNVIAGGQRFFRLMQ
jgi:hypothetical protein